METYMETFGNQNEQISAFKFYCIFCDYGTSRKSNYNTHIDSTKHSKNSKMETFGNIQQKNKQKISKTNGQNSCKTCNKLFKNRSGLWKHNKNCLTKDDIISLIPNTIEGQKELIEFLVKENSEFKQLMIEQNKTMMELAKNSGNYSSHTTNNTTNNHFNLNFFLNETCKNAMNIMDFVSQLPVTVKNLEDTGRLGFAEGISKIFIDGLTQMNVSDRPIHCSDHKREIIYIKNNNEWNKESDNKILLTKAIKHIAHKNIKQISEWTKIYPDCINADSNKNDKYLRIVSESMSGSSEEESNKNYSKIIKNIVRETVINKSNDNW
jgi:hypothetical protein